MFTVFQTQKSVFSTTQHAWPLVRVRMVNAWMGRQQMESQDDLSDHLPHLLTLLMAAVHLTSDVLYIIFHHLGRTLQCVAWDDDTEVCSIARFRCCC